MTCRLDLPSIVSVGILGKEREPRVGKLGWHGNFDTGFERNTVTDVISFKIPSAGFSNFIEIASVLLVYLPSDNEKVKHTYFVFWFLGE